MMTFLPSVYRDVAPQTQQTPSGRIFVTMAASSWQFISSNMIPSGTTLHRERS
jgi:hypothetical protein